MIAIQAWAYLDLHSLTDQAKSNNEESDKQNSLHAGWFFRERFSCSMFSSVVVTAISAFLLFLSQLI